MVLKRDGSAFTVLLQFFTGWFLWQTCIGWIHAQHSCTGFVVGGGHVIFSRLPVTWEPEVFFLGLTSGKGGWEAVNMNWVCSDWTSWISLDVSVVGHAWKFKGLKRLLRFPNWFGKGWVSVWDGMGMVVLLEQVPFGDYFGLILEGWVTVDPRWSKDFVWVLKQGWNDCIIVMIIDSYIVGL